MSHRALGLIETRGLIGAIEATDVAAKTADVIISAIGPSDAPTVTLKIEGELAAVQAAVEAGARAAQRLGLLVASHVIPKPHESLDALLDTKRNLVAQWISPHAGDAPTPVLPKVSMRSSVTRSATPLRRTAEKPKPTVKEPVKVAATTVPAPAKSSVGAPSWGELEAMPVVKLRQFCRNVSALPIQGRQISMANKQVLLEALKGIGYGG